MDKYINDALSTVQKWLPKNAKELEWWIKFRRPDDILKKHATFLYCEIVFYILAFLTFCHAMRTGGRFRYLWFATIAHGITVEAVSFFTPDIDNFWHGQSMVMMLGQRLPLHILLVYPVFIYTANVAVSHMNLRWWALPFAVGLTVVIFDVPFDMMAIKLLWWTWHDDDPNIYDRNYWVPWTSHFFHSSFAAAFTFVFFGLRSLLCRSGPRYQSPGFFCEIPIVILTGLLSFPLAALLFVLIYHPLHDSLGIHTEVCVMLYLTVFALIVWSADRTPIESARISGNRLFNAITLTVILHYGFYIYLVFTAKPEEMKSVGYHQPVGPCDHPVTVWTPFGHVLKKQKYLCVDRYHEDYFDFSCVKKPPADKTEWYTICGTPYTNHAEYIIVVCASCAFGLFWFWQLLARSGNLPRTRPTKTKQHKD